MRFVWLLPALALSGASARASGAEWGDVPSTDSTRPKPDPAEGSSDPGRPKKFWQPRVGASVGAALDPHGLFGQSASVFAGTDTGDQNFVGLGYRYIDGDNLHDPGDDGGVSGARSHSATLVDELSLTSQRGFRPYLRGELGFGSYELNRELSESPNLSSSSFTLGFTFGVEYRFVARDRPDTSPFGLGLELSYVTLPNAHEIHGYGSEWIMGALRCDVAL